MPSGPPVLLTACITAGADAALLLRQFDQCGGHGRRHGEAGPEPATDHPAATNRLLEPTLVSGSEEQPDREQTKPAATATLAPARCTTRAAGTAPTMSPPTRGSSRGPIPWRWSRARPGSTAAW